MNINNTTYIVHNNNNSVKKETNNREEAKKIAVQLTLVFGEFFAIDVDVKKDLWALNYNR